jgi:hypothetical protein
MTLQTLFGPNPWAAELTALLTPFVPPVVVTAVVYANVNGSENGNENGGENGNESGRPLAWAVGALLAGVGNFGWGSVIVGLLYHTVGE